MTNDPILTGENPKADDRLCRDVMNAPLVALGPDSIDQVKPDPFAEIRRTLTALNAALGKARDQLDKAQAIIDAARARP